MTVVAPSMASLVGSTGELTDSRTREQLASLLLAFEDWIDLVAGGSEAGGVSEPGQ